MQELTLCKGYLLCYVTHLGLQCRFRIYFLKSIPLNNYKVYKKRNELHQLILIKSEKYFSWRLNTHHMYSNLSMLNVFVYSRSYLCTPRRPETFGIKGLGQLFSTYKRFSTKREQVYCVANHSSRVFHLYSHYLSQLHSLWQYLSLMSLPPLTLFFIALHYVSHYYHFIFALCAWSIHV